MIEAGQPEPLGATFDGNGVNFAIYSSVAEAVELCLFDAESRELGRLHLKNQTNHVWHGYLPGGLPGLLYGYRVHGAYAPETGRRCNANKLLLDPYARELTGEFTWSPAAFDFNLHHGKMKIDTTDNSSCMPRCVVAAPRSVPTVTGPAVPWSEMIIYELNVRGYTMLHPDVADLERGTFLGMTNASVLCYLKSLGITSVELMPVHAFIDEKFLSLRGRRNFWGYNTVNFFALARRLARGDSRDEFRAMVNAIHDAGMEVIMDVAFNHTGESDRLGPTLSFRGIDNLSYYRTEPGNPGKYVDDTGCGNTLNVDHPRVQGLIVDSLRYWAQDMGVDGFRFDLATALGRGPSGFDKKHPLLLAIQADAVLRDRKFIAEPWDLGSSGYQLGNFPAGWAEWNDRFRDSARRFWRGDGNESAELAGRLLGSADIFDTGGRSPCASVNYVTAHDGFTLTDVVTYERRHNGANGEGNVDGHSQNFSCNYGVEGPTSDAAICALRRKQRLNLLSMLLLSQGTPMMLGGDEFGNSQNGNNNAYAQDNATGWLDWSGIQADPEFPGAVRQLVGLRKASAHFRQASFLHGRAVNQYGTRDVEWLRPGGEVMRPEDWIDAPALSLCLAAASRESPDGAHVFAVLLNTTQESRKFHMPNYDQPSHWRLRFSSEPSYFAKKQDSSIEVPGRSVVVVEKADSATNLELP